MHIIKKINKIVFILIIMIFLLNTTTGAISLWSEESANIYKSKEKVFVPGDVVTIIIEETSDAVQSANTSLSQGSSVDGGGGLGLFSFLETFGFNYSDQDDSEGQTQRSGTLNADITTQIVEVMDNGNLKIEGTKTIKINGEKQVINLSGVIRPGDINEENNVSSQKVANASIDFEGKGVVSEKQRPNIFQRILNWIF
ncbi:MAG: flagellar basal body L-ring protein FlgH [Bacillota bacterium]